MIVVKEKPPCHPITGPLTTTWQVRLSLRLPVSRIASRYFCSWRSYRDLVPRWRTASFSFICRLPSYSLAVASISNQTCWTLTWAKERTLWNVSLISLQCGVKENGGKTYIFPWFPFFLCFNLISCLWPIYYFCVASSTFCYCIVFWALDSWDLSLCSKNLRSPPASN